MISQQPAEVNRTVVSQCNNSIAMRLTNSDDQTVVRRLLPNSLGGFDDLLLVLDTGEALVVGDAIWTALSGCLRGMYKLPPASTHAESSAV